MTKPEDKLTWKDIEIGLLPPNRAAPASIRPATGVPAGRPMNFRNVSNALSARPFVRKAAIKPNKEGYYEADLYYCKGCGICAKECPKKVITMVEEKE